MKYVYKEYHPKAATSAVLGQQIGETLTHIIIMDKDGLSKYILKDEPGFSDQHTVRLPNVC